MGDRYDEAVAKLSDGDADVLADVEAAMDEPGDAVGAVPFLPPLAEAVLLSLLKRQAGPVVLGFVAKELMRERVDRDDANALEVGATVDLDAPFHGRGRNWGVAAVAGSKRG